MKFVIFFLLSSFTSFNVLAQKEVYHLKSITINKEKHTFEKIYYQVVLDKQRKVFYIPGTDIYQYKIKNWELIGSTGVNKTYVGLISDAEYEFSVIQQLFVTGNECTFLLESTDKLILIYIECYAKAYESGIRFDFPEQYLTKYGIIANGTILFSSGKIGYSHHLNLDLKERRLYSDEISEINYKVLSRKLIEDNARFKIFEGLLSRRGNKVKYIQSCDKETGNTKFVLTNALNKKAVFLLHTINPGIKATDTLMESETTLIESDETIVSADQIIEFSEPPILSGTSFFISAEGYLATNAHIIEDATDIKVSVPLKTGLVTYKAKLVKIDVQNDIAIVKISDSKFQGMGPLPYTIADYTEIGEVVFTIGYPLNFIMGTNFKLSTGIVNATTGIADDARYLQISVPLQSGNSGGPLFNEMGSIIGITSAKLNGKKLGIEIENVNYAIKAYYLLKIMKEANIQYKPNNLTLKGKGIKEHVQSIKQYVCIITAQ